MCRQGRYSSGLTEMDGSRKLKGIVQIQRYSRLRLINSYPMIIGKHQRWTLAHFIMGAGISVLSLLEAMTDNELPRALQSVFNFVLVKDSQSLGS